MPKEDISKCLNDSKMGSNNRKLLEFCSVPRVASELARSGVKGDYYKHIVELMRCGAIEFKDSKYLATKDGIDSFNG